METLFEFFLPILIPPVVLIRLKKLPSCPKLFETISKNPRNSRILGRRFMYLCRITGFLWILWICDSVLSLACLGMVAYHWAMNLDMTTIKTFGLSCRMVLAMFGTLVGVGGLMAYALG